MGDRTDADHALRRSRDAVLSRAPAPRVPAPRTEVAASWERVAACGLEPGADPSVRPLTADEVERRRTTSRLAALIPSLTESLAPVIDAGQMMVVADPDGRVLWRRGGTGVRREADQLGFVNGSAWTEANVGTNAIGTALVLGEPFYLRGAEHFADSHLRWGCAAAPLTDPWTGETLGIVDVSGPSRSMHPAELALVELAARMTSLQVVAVHRDRLDRLRAHAAPVLAKVGGRAIAVDRYGHVAAASGVSAPSRVELPSDLTVGEVWLPGLGPARAEALPGGWLLRMDPGADLDSAVATSLVLDLRAAPRVELVGPSGSFDHRLSPRRTELLAALMLAGAEGRTAAELAADLFADATRVVTVRAELSRIRRVLGSVLLSEPYRLAPSVSTSLLLPDEAATLLPASSAPVILRLRRSAPATRPAPSGRR